MRAAPTLTRARLPHDGTPSCTLRSANSINNDHNLMRPVETAEAFGCLTRPQRPTADRQPKGARYGPGRYRAGHARFGTEALRCGDARGWFGAGVWLLCGAASASATSLITSPCCASGATQ